MNRPFLRRFSYTSVALVVALVVMVAAVFWNINVFDLPGVDVIGIEQNEAGEIFMAFLLVIPAFFLDRAVTRHRMLKARLQGEQLRVLRATMRTVQDIVSNALQSLYLFRVEAEPNVTPQALELFDHIIGDTAARLKALGDLDTVTETDMVMGAGIAYQPPAVKPAG